jgi:hypothetical protein
MSADLAEEAVAAAEAAARQHRDFQHAVDLLLDANNKMATMVILPPPPPPTGNDQLPLGWVNQEIKAKPGKYSTKRECDIAFLKAYPRVRTVPVARDLVVVYQQWANSRYDPCIEFAAQRKLFDLKREFTKTTLESAIIDFITSSDGRATVAAT